MNDPKRQHGSLSYRPDIDGLRAISVLAVVAFHAGLGVTGGYIGVDVFFVISGFLITKKIITDIDNRSFSYFDFWARRARRLVPASVVVVAATLIAGYFVLFPKDFRELGQSCVAQAVGLSNVYFYRESGYFAGPSEMKPLLHLWSLAVEEQFYLVIPIVLAVGNRFRRSYTFTLLVLGTVSLITSVFLTDSHPEAAFFLLPARAWEMMLGGLMAVYVDVGKLNRVVSESLGLLGIGAVIFSVFQFSESTAFPGASALIPTLGAAGIIVSGKFHNTVVKRLLSTPFLVFTGGISYSFYLWHWPIFAFSNYVQFGKRGLLTNIFLVVVSGILGWLSWRYVEEPFRHGLLGWAKNRGALKRAAICLATMCVAGFIATNGNGIKSRFSEKTLQYFSQGQNRSDNKFIKRHFDISFSKLKVDGIPKILDSATAPRIAIVGDSHAGSLFPAFAELLSTFELQGVGVSRGSNIPIRTVGFPQNGEYLSVVVDQLDSTPSITDVFLLARWSSYGKILKFNDLKESLARMAGQNRRVWVVSQVPKQNASVPRGLALCSHFEWSNDRVATTRESHEKQLAQFKVLANKLSEERCHVVDLSPFFFLHSSQSLIEINGQALYYDDNHLSAFGARQLVPTLRPIFEKISILDSHN